MRVNFTEDTPSFTGFDAIPKGWYHVKVTDGDEVETKNAGKLEVGTPGINWEFTVQDGKYANRKVFTNTWIAPSTLGFIKGLLEASGRYSTEQLTGPLDFEIDDVIGADLYVKVTTRDYNGDDVNDVKSIKPWKGEESKWDEPADAASSAKTSLLPS